MTMVTEQEDGQALPERWSAKAKTEAVEAVSREVQVPAHELEAWRRVFLEAGSNGLKARGDPETRAVKHAQAKVGELAMRLELAEMLLGKRGTGRSWRG